jgi:hypothetical protein
MQDYVAIPQLSAEAMLALARSILSNAPLGAVPDAAKSLVEDALQRIHSQAVALQTGLVSRLGQDRSQTVAPLDAELDAQWRGCHLVIQGFKEMSGEKQAAALRLDQALFSEGLAFLRAKFDVQWAESEARLTRLDQDPALVGDLETLCGNDTLAALRDLHGKYGDALGITAVRQDSEPPNIIEPLRKLKDAVRLYVLRGVAAFDPDSAADKETLSKMLRPIEDSRKSLSSGAPEPAADEPIPPIPSAAQSI